MTERLYYADSKMKLFKARVTSCEKINDGWAVTLDRTAFSPRAAARRATADI